MTNPATPEAERIDLHLDAEAKRKIQHAAEREGRTLNTFIVESALLSADQSLQAHERMVLSGHDAEALFAALTSPPEPGTARTEAMREYQERVTSR
ncbi:MAG: DUF1778 domain-containing protein [Thiohalocapsa sp. PB-PSB1]|jgi:uncharacterized protein (DUF1778 family)|nr:MAG: hypothetical protein N838_09185 [Thiohalocapsa sp. PB-PSB1]QQO54360.1 MAG: DUF1778 domain-containing protein [Thiohalocapsa sp. PB-PSB1]